MRHLAFVAVGLVVSTGAALALDVAAGETSYRKCALCHSIGPDAANKVGPELNGLDGRKAGTVEIQLQRRQQGLGPLAGTGPGLQCLLPDRSLT